MAKEPFSSVRCRGPCQSQPGHGVRPEVNGDRTVPDITLSRATTFEGVVVDPAGKTVAGAEIFVMNGVNSTTISSGPIKTRPDGTFRIPQLDPNGQFAIRVRADATAQSPNGAVVVRMKEQKGRLTITVDPRFAFRMHGTVAERAGKPIAGAEVRLNWMRQMPSDDPRRSGSMGGTMALLTTDSSGRFRTAPFPGDTYTLNLTARGFAPFQTEEFVGARGLSRGLGTIKLVATSGFIAGQVVGSDGKPIAGVTVFNRGNCLQPVTTRTDAAGRFRLEGLFPGTQVRVRPEGRISFDRCAGRGR